MSVKVIGPKDVTALVLLVATMSAIGGWLLAKKK